MELKEELEILRGEPIQVFKGDPLKDIPCIETSDADHLCKNPVVSVCMVTYNHEPYIRQAIEGVMMQKTDFEFELVIGEDCSTDKTREICFEYQKRYPNKIRVLWSNENIFGGKCAAGDNGTRTLAHCRGEFIAFCEGDDYWIDPLKLQNQVDILHRFPNVGFCFCAAEITNETNHRTRIWNSFGYWREGMISGSEFFARFGYGMPKGGIDSDFIMTATVMSRRTVLLEAKDRFPIMRWRLYLGDLPTWMALASLADAYFLDRKVSVYRQTERGAASQNAMRVGFDASLARLWYWVEKNGKRGCGFPPNLISSILLVWLYRICEKEGRCYFGKLLRSMSILGPVFLGWRLRMVIWIRCIGGSGSLSFRVAAKYLWSIYPVLAKHSHGR